MSCGPDATPQNSSATSSNEAEVSALAPPPEPEKIPEKPLPPPVLGISMPAQANAFSEAILASIQSASTNWNAIIRAEREEAQEQSINRFLVDGVDAVLFIPGRPSGWNMVLGKASQSNVPVFLVGENVEIENPDYIACRLVPGASDVRNTLGRPLLALADGKGIVEISTPGTAVPLWRNDLGFSVLARQNATTRQEGRRTASALANLFEGEIGLVLAYKDPVAIGAAEALAYRNQGEAIPVVSLSGGHEALEALEAGTLHAVAVPSPETGSLLFDAIETARRGRHLQPVVSLPVVLQEAK